MAATTCATVISDMQRGFLQGEKRKFSGWMQGLHANPAHSTWDRAPSGPQSCGVSGPKSTSASMSVIEANCPGPLSLVTSTSDRQYKTSSSRRVVFPAMLTARDEPIS